MWEYLEFPDNPQQFVLKGFYPDKRNFLKIPTTLIVVSQHPTLCILTPQHSLYNDTPKLYSNTLAVCIQTVLVFVSQHPST